MGADYVSISPCCGEDYVWEERFEKYRCKKCHALFIKPVEETVDYGDEVYDPEE